MNPTAILLCICMGLVYWSTGQSQTLEAEAGVSSDTSGWDWGEIEAMDDTPVSAKKVIRKDASEMPASRLTLEQATAPDLEANPRKVYSLFPDMPDFEVIPSKKDAELYPCKNCHEWVKSNTEPRILEQPHDNFQLKHGLHGKGQFWCFTCHDKQDKGNLVTLQGEYLEFNEAYILCSQCHVKEARDWAYGAHGKRVGNWKGKRQVYNCTACHYQHSPAIKSRQALNGPEIRTGLERPKHWAPKVRHDVVKYKHRVQQP